MKKRYIIFRAAGRTVRFMAKTSKRGVAKGRSKVVHYAVRQRSLKHKINRTVPKGYSNPMYRAPKGKCWACATCGRRYINQGAAKNHVIRSNHAYITRVKV